MARIARFVELAARTSDGLTVKLVYDRLSKIDPEKHPLLVQVWDEDRGEAFTLRCDTGREGIDAYYHPFAAAKAALVGAGLSS